MPIGFRQDRQLDPKLCWKLIGHDGISCYKAPIVLKNEYGQYNVRTGKPFSHQGVWESANSYLLDNMVEARKDTEDVWKANGRLLSDADWYKIVIEKARYLSPKKYKAFMETHQYLTPYLTQ